MKNFNNLAGFLQESLIKKVNKEAEIEHANDPQPEIPKCEETKVVKGKPGWYNLIRTILP